MPRRNDAPGQGFLFPDHPQRVNKITPAESASAAPLDHEALFEDSAEGSRRRPEIPASIDDLVAVCGLHLLNVRQFDYRVGQAECIFDICRSDANFAVKGALGSGKTNVALAVGAGCLERDGHVLYLTPFDNLVGQTEERARSILTVEGGHIHAIRDNWQPKRRAELYQQALALPGGHLVIATPGKVLNDIIEGRLSSAALDKFHLAVFDECHLAFGNLPYVELMTRFKARGVRLLGFTGTMGKDKDHRAVILENLGANEIYTIAAPKLERTVFAPRMLQLDPPFILAAERLTSVAKETLQRLGNSLGEIAAEFGHSDVRDAAAALEDRFLTGPRFSMPVKKAILGMHSVIRDILVHHPETGPYYQAASLAHAVDHLQQLHDRLTRFGRYAFLKLAADKLLALEVPELRDAKDPSGNSAGKSKPRVPRYIEQVYRSEDVLSAYETAAHGTPFAIVPELHTIAAVRRAFDRPAGAETTGGALRRAVLDSLRQEMVLLDYSDHPKEAAVFSILADDAGRSRRRPTIIFVELVESAAFLVDRIHSTKDIDTKAVLCVGAGHAAPLPREEAIRRFDAGAAHVIVATSALEVGQDTQTAERVINFIQTPEAIRLAQRMGRAGRRGTGAIIIDLVTKDYEPQFFAGQANRRTMDRA